MRKAFIDWKRLDGTSGLEPGKEYMCFAADPASMSGSLCFARYYKKGDVVKLPLRQDYRPDDKEPTAEERLLSAIFGRSKRYVVPMDGLYEQTGDYGVDEKCENGAFEGCSEQLVLTGNALPDGTEGAVPVFWAECPLLPAGYKSLDGAKLAAGTDKARAEALRNGLEDSEDAMYAYQGLCGRQAPLPGDGTDCSVHVQGAVCSVSPERAAALVIDVCSSARKLAAVEPKDEIQAFLDAFSAAKSHEDAVRLWNDFREKHGLTVKEGSYALKALMAMSGQAPGFYQCRDRILARGGAGAMDNVRVVVEAWGLSQLPNRLERLSNLYRLGAPSVIMQNELRIACEYAAAWRFADDIARVTDRFAASFGINPDGTRSGACEKVGDAELMHDYLESQACGHDCGNCGVSYCDERDGAMDGDEEDENGAPGEPMPRYVMAYMPNFLMRTPGVAIIDNETDRFLRNPDGSIEIWTECPRERLEQLNAGA